METITEKNKNYLTKQLITYIGNKRDLLQQIEKYILLVKKELNKKDLITVDLFSGSGVVARLLKCYSSLVIANDLELYSKIVNEAFLSNSDELDNKLFNNYLEKINNKIICSPYKGLVSNYYAPKDDNNIKKGERVFYTKYNATYIDSFVHYMDEVVPDNDKKYKIFLLAVLITEASIHTNTCGVFKGFYKDKNTNVGKFGGTAENALIRIKGNIKITPPIVQQENKI